MRSVKTQNSTTTNFGGRDTCPDSRLRRGRGRGRATCGSRAQGKHTEAEPFVLTPGLTVATWPTRPGPCLGGDSRSEHLSTRSCRSIRLLVLLLLLLLLVLLLRWWLVLLLLLQGTAQGEREGKESAKVCSSLADPAISPLELGGVAVQKCCVHFATVRN